MVLCSFCLLFTLIGIPAFAGEAKSLVPDHSKVPGVIIDYIPAITKTYIGSPSLAILPNGDYVAAHDFFGPESGWNQTRVHLSKDKGRTWEVINNMVGQWWSTLFYHQDALYLIGTTTEYGKIVIRKSTDGGHTWTTPDTATTGLLMSTGEYHCAPVPMLIHQGRLWRAFEEYADKWGTGFSPFVMSAPVAADLLNAQSWTRSNSLKWGGWEPYKGWLEGNVVLTPDQKLVDILRVHESQQDNKAAVVEISEDGKTVSFDPQTGFIDFPGGCKKFTIRWDPTTQRYLSLTNSIHPDDIHVPNKERVRNTLTLISSPDLKKWTMHQVILHAVDYEKTGFQYVDWLFEDKDLIFVSRTAFEDGLGGAHNCHDANYMTFHRITDYRKHLETQTAPMR
jgi:hypothetical protein